MLSHDWIYWIREASRRGQEESKLFEGSSTLVTATIVDVKFAERSGNPESPGNWLEKGKGKRKDR
jgi:hypothetical protein